MLLQVLGRIGFSKRCVSMKYYWWLCIVSINKLKNVSENINILLSCSLVTFGWISIILIWMVLILIVHARLLIIISSHTNVLYRFPVRSIQLRTIRMAQWLYIRTLVSLERAINQRGQPILRIPPVIKYTCRPARPQEHLLALAANILRLYPSLCRMRF